MKKYRRLWAIAFLHILISLSLLSQGLPTVKPEKVGLCPKRLARIGPFMQNYVDQGKLPGMITLIARQGKVAFFEKYGLMDENKKMQFDTIFQIASMTKPVTSVAVMMLYEEGRFQLSDPIHKYIPEFKDLKVYKSMKEGKMVTEKLKRPVTIRDLLTHTSGLTYGFFGDTPVDKLYQKAGLFQGTCRDMVTKLKSLPLLFQPGARWNYGVSTDILGYLVEVVSGISLDTFFREKIFRPLGMKDTGFYVPKEKITRLAARYGLTKKGKLKILTKPFTTGKPPRFLSGGGGLYSTMSDYARFAHMLLNMGKLEGVRILGRKTVEFMTMDHLPKKGAAVSTGPGGDGFGLGFAVVVNVPGRQILGSCGEYGWAGIYNTFFWIDPKEKMILILMTQFSPFQKYPVNNEFKVLGYQAIVK